MFTPIEGAAIRVASPLGVQAPSGTSGTPSTSRFGEMLGAALESVNQLQLDAEEAARLLAVGEIDDVHTVTLASARADLALQLTIQIRNKVLDAYQEITRMQI